MIVLFVLANVAAMNADIYKSLTPKEKLFVDLLHEIKELLETIVAIDSERT